MSKFFRQKMSRPKGGLESPNWLILLWVAYHRRTEEAFGLVHVEVGQWGSRKFIIFHTYVQWISKRNCVCKIDRINTDGMIQDSRFVWYQTILNVLLSNLSYKSNKISKPKWSSSCLAVVFAQFIEQGVRSRMKMLLEQRPQAMLQLHLSDQQFIVW